jgi:hypothetical protein
LLAAVISRSDPFSDELLGKVETDLLDAPVMSASGRAAEVVMQRGHPTDRPSSVTARCGDH